MEKNKLDMMELKEFNELVDKTIKYHMDRREQAAEKKIIEPVKEEPKKLKNALEAIESEEKSSDEIVASVIEKTLEEKAEANRPLTKEESFTPTIIGKPGKTLIVITSKEGKETIFGNGAEAARHFGINPTTSRERSKKGYTDNEGNTWSSRPNNY